MKKTFTLFLMMLLCGMTFAQVSTWDGTWEAWTNGTGTEDDPFLIENTQQLAYLAYRVNNGFGANENHVVGVGEYYKLMVDVNLNGSESFQWVPIGYWNNGADCYSFGGRFDGNNHLIQNLFINSGADRIGLFGFVSCSSITNIDVIGNVVTSGAHAGGIIGYVSDSIIINHSSFDGHVASTSTAGGIIGVSLKQAIISDCSNSGSVYANSYYGTCTGGIIALSEGLVIIKNCYNIGDISSRNGSGAYQDGRTGGILGLGASANIINCYNTGNISSEYNGYLGGIVARVGGNIANCYNSGIISGSHKGGIVWDYLNPTTITNCFFLNTCGGTNNIGELKTEAFMKSQDFVDLINVGCLAYAKDNQPYTNQGYPIFSGFFIETEPVSSLEYTSATLQGNYVSGILDITSQGFEYKLKTEQEYTTIICPKNQTPFSYTITGLASGTEYQYRAFLTSSVGTAYGELLDFTTLTLPTYIINASTSDHGSINPEGEVEVQEGETITFSFKPDEGFEIGEILVDGESVQLASNYTFNNVTTDHTITVTFVELTGPCLPPLNLIVSEIHATSARLNWQGGADVYIIIYGVDGNYNHAISTSENSIVLDDLIPTSNYVWKIKSVCGELETRFVDGQPFFTSGHGVDENNSVAFSLWPNPTNETLNIASDNLKRVELYDVLGQLVIVKESQDVTTSVDVSNLKAGLYLVRVTDTKGNVGIEKVMITPR